MSTVNRVQRRRRQGESGFTLIELLVVIGILGVLAGIVIFNVTGVSDRGALAACRTDVSTIQAAADAFRNNPPAPNVPPGSAGLDGSPGVPPANTTVLVQDNYLHSSPTACKSYSIDTNAASTTYGKVTAIAKDGVTNVP